MGLCSIAKMGDETETHRQRRRRRVQECSENFDKVRFVGQT